MPTDTVSITQFIKDERISMTAERTDQNPNMDDASNMDHWKVVFKRRSNQGLGRHIAKMTTYFSMGYGHNGKEPKAGEVLNCLAMDAASLENARGFEDWASDLGYDTDSRKAEKIYKACEHASRRLKAFLGGEAYQLLLWHTDQSGE
jgi:hypothetical protein